MPAKGVAVVTGASYGLGATIAKQLACEAKYEVVLVARWVIVSPVLCHILFCKVPSFIVVV